MLFLLSGDHRALPVHTHSCPARRSSNLLVCGRRFYHSCPLHTPVNFRRARSHSLWDMPQAAAPTSWHATSPTSCLANGAICQWPLLLTLFWPTELTHPFFADRKSVV